MLHRTFQIGPAEVFRSARHRQCTSADQSSRADCCQHKKGCGSHSNPALGNRLTRPDTGPELDERHIYDNGPYSLPKTYRILCVPVLLHPWVQNRVTRVSKNHTEGCFALPFPGTAPPAGCRPPQRAAGIPVRRRPGVRLAQPGTAGTTVFHSSRGGPGAGTNRSPNNRSVLRTYSAESSPRSSPARRIQLWCQ